MNEEGHFSLILIPVLQGLVSIPFMMGGVAKNHQSVSKLAELACKNV